MDHRRLFRAQYQDISIQSRVGYQQYAVSGSRGATYQVNLQNPSCTCPDWQKRKPTDGCKHILAVKIQRKEIDPLPSNNLYTSCGQFESPDIPNWMTIVQRTKRRDNWTCQICKKQAGKFDQTELHTHHIIPKSKNKENNHKNLITVCSSCHKDLHVHKTPNNAPDNAPVTGGSSQSSGSGIEPPRKSPQPSTRKQYRSEAGGKSSRNSDPRSESCRTLTKEDDPRCSSCGDIFEFHSTMRDLCNDCLAEAAPDQTAGESSLSQPTPSKTNRFKKRQGGSSSKEFGDYSPAPREKRRGRLPSYIEGDNESATTSDASSTSPSQSQAESSSHDTRPSSPVEDSGQYVEADKEYPRHESSAPQPQSSSLTHNNDSSSTKDSDSYVEAGKEYLTHESPSRPPYSSSTQSRTASSTAKSSQTRSDFSRQAGNAHSNTKSSSQTNSDPPEQVSSTSSDARSASLLDNSYSSLWLSSALLFAFLGGAIRWLKQTGGLTPPAEGLITIISFGGVNILIYIAILYLLLFVGSITFSGG